MRNFKTIPHIFLIYKKNCTMKQFEQMTPNQILNFLENNADEITEGAYMKPLSEDDRAEIKDRFVQDSITLAHNQEELKAFNESFKAEKIKPLALQLDTDRNTLKLGKLASNGRLYTLRNFDESEVVVYDVNGSIIERRRMRPNEKQATVFHMNKAV